MVKVHRSELTELASEPHRMTRQPAVNRSAEPAMVCTPTCRCAVESVAFSSVRVRKRPTGRSGHVSGVFVDAERRVLLGAKDVEYWLFDPDARR